MNKNTFMEEVGKRLDGMPASDVKRSLDYYSEMIDDRIEDGEDEESAVAAMGTVGEVADRILSESNVKTPHRGRRLRVWEIVLIILGSPLWVTLAVAAAIVVLALYVVLWSVVVAFYAVVLALVCAALICLAAAVAMLVTGSLSNALLILGTCFICAGIAAFGFLGCAVTTKGILHLSVKLAKRIKSSLKGEVKQNEKIG